MAQPQGERIVALEQRIADHESRCEERLSEIKATATSTNAKIDKLQWWVIAQLVGITGFCIVTLAAIVLRKQGLA